MDRDVAKAERDHAQMRRYRRYLLAEVRIVRPRLIVGMGHRAYGILAAPSSNALSARSTRGLSRQAAQ